jgi:hypothetical protein
MLLLLRLNFLLESSLHLRELGHLFPQEVNFLAFSELDFLLLRRVLNNRQELAANYSIYKDKYSNMTLLTAMIKVIRNK